MRGTIRVLVVDDSAFVRKVVTQMLSRSPFIEVAARSAGDDATDLLGSYFSRGDLSELWGLLEAGGLWPAATMTRATTLRSGVELSNAGSDANGSI